MTPNIHNYCLLNFDAGTASNGQWFIDLALKKSDVLQVTVSRIGLNVKCLLDEIGRSAVSVHRG